MELFKTILMIYCFLEIKIEFKNFFHLLFITKHLKEF